MGSLPDWPAVLSTHRLKYRFYFNSFWQFQFLPQFNYIFQNWFTLQILFCGSSNPSMSDISLTQKWYNENHTDWHFRKIRIIFFIIWLWIFSADLLFMKWILSLCSNVLHKLNLEVWIWEYCVENRKPALVNPSVILQFLNTIVLNIFITDYLEHIDIAN